MTLGPLLFNWPAQQVRDFYAMIADETAVDRVYLGEVVCGKRAPLLAAVMTEAAERLARARKAVVWSTLALPSTDREQRQLGELVAGPYCVELNDISGLAHLRAGAEFVAGPFLNIYNEVAAQELIHRGCTRLCANVELPLAAISKIARACPGLELEIFAFGRLPLAISSRCHHARLHRLHKDACQYVCGRDPDGLAVRTVEGEPFIAVNGVQVLSHGAQIADAPVQTLRDAGVRALRLSPHSGDMCAIAGAFREFADGIISASALRDAVAAAVAYGPLVNGYLYGRPGAARAGAAP